MPNAHWVVTVDTGTTEPLNDRQTWLCLACLAYVIKQGSAGPANVMATGIPLRGEKKLIEFQGPAAPTTSQESVYMCAQPPGTSPNWSRSHLFKRGNVQSLVTRGLRLAHPACGYRCHLWRHCGRGSVELPAPVAREARFQAQRLDP